ncbi:sulfite exporter TauE/SafE family protein [Lederbergia lenta]|uniref:Probable membrane transporter protein n=1 Tax=Lederbergia lenta TaxID=1467 RepID=A0A2X4ZSF8_LEDLE|nr:sulfite exporter TauE/SafE family protein [Lederbergia lenta]MCM3112168.1 sulfite exporter TauE/SafE family protein [Lederbergia lenta]MEC2323339.1 sulfite exporter TauE/SafE family protein [Lederbergia lenta]SQI63244.1 Sulfite exporter TauE/SafE [Lederbergia lenta]
MYIITIVYLLIGLLASIIGSIAGLGGGIIIKPVLDSIGTYDVATIGLLSTTTVFAMACVSLLKATRSGIRIKGRKSFIIAIGSIVGGLIGKFIFNYLVRSMEDQKIIIVIQATLLTVLMLLILLFVRNRESIKTYQLQNAILIFTIGFGLGTLSSFLGIGGGPLNMAILAFAFSMNIRESAINSIFIIFFSQLSSLITTAFTTGFTIFDLSVLGYMVTGGVIGGLIGTTLSQKFNNLQMDRIFTYTLVGIILLNIYNAIYNLL